MSLLLNVKFEHVSADSFADIEQVNTDWDVDLEQSIQESTK